LLLPLALLLAWQAAVGSGWADSTIWASPASVLAAVGAAARDGDFATDLGASLHRDLAGLSIGVPVGLATGIALGLSGLANRLFTPSLSAIRQVALFSWVPVISVWLGNDEPAKIAFIAFAVFFPVMLAAQQGVRGVDPKLLEVALSLQLSRWQRLRAVIMPGALPAILSGLHLALVYAWLATVGAEYLFSAGPGIGSALMTARAQFRMDQVIAGMIAIAAIGVLFNQAAGLAERRLLRARGGADGSAR
jgi:sulfonate transport system permease protein